MLPVTPDVISKTFETRSVKNKNANFKIALALKD